MDDLIMRTLPYMPGAAGRYSGADRYTSGQGVARIDRTPLNYAARQAPPIPQGVAPAPVVAMGAPQAPATPYQSSTPGAARGESVGSLGLGGSSAGIPNMDPGGSSWLGNLDLSPKDAAATGWRVAGPAGAVAGGLLGWASSSARAADPTNPSSVNAVNGMDAQSDAARAAAVQAEAQRRLAAAQQYRSSSSSAAAQQRSFNSFTSGYGTGNGDGSGGSGD